MSFYTWFRNRCPARAKATTAYKRGMKQANYHNHQAAIDEYTIAIKVPDAPSDVKAMALFNRAIVYAAVHQDELAIDDLRTLLSMSDAPAEVRTEARRKLVRMDRRSKTGSAQCALKSAMSIPLGTQGRGIGLIVLEARLRDDPVRANLGM